MSSSHCVGSSPSFNHPSHRNKTERKQNKMNIMAYVVGGGSSENEIRCQSPQEAHNHQEHHPQNLHVQDQSESHKFRVCEDGWTSERRDIPGLPFEKHGVTSGIPPQRLNCICKWLPQAASTESPHQYLLPS